MTKCSIGRLHSIETLGALDGPGLRTVLFFQGCPMGCAYCHNPDTWDPNGGQTYTAEALIKKILRYKPYYGKDGGVTFSGGEPLLQAGFALELARQCRGNGIHVALDTSGALCSPAVYGLLQTVNLVLLDVKHADPQQFKELTRYPMDNLLQVIAWLRELQTPVWFRQVVVPGLTDSREQLAAALSQVQGLHLEKIELLPYHTHGVPKWEKLGLSYRLSGVKPPEEETMEALQAFANGYWNQQ